MQQLWSIFGIALLIVVVGLHTPASAQQCSNSVFCGGWHTVCLRTCPSGDCTAVCNSRKAECLSSGCYHFNSPRPRCKNNPEDMRLTTACDSPSKKG